MTKITGLETKFETFRIEDYYFGTAKLPQKVLAKLTNIIRCFFWGKEEGNRYLAYVAWDNITTPTWLGGLAIRDLERVNQALLMKFLWRLAAQADSLWVKVVKAKYMPRSELWHSKRVYICTLFWRNIMQLRDKLAPWLSWKIGDGSKCTVFAQPWFPGLSFINLNCQFKGTSGYLIWYKIETGGWDAGKLIQFFEYENCLRILSNIKPPTNDGGEDTLVFNLTVNGRYSVKKSYNEINTSWRMSNVNQPALWDKVWRYGSIQPRVRLFLWKLLNSVVPLAKVINGRIGTGSSVCSICAQGDEDA